MSISLCVIAGNEERVIDRFLKSFAESFDELSLVRAVGSQQPDKTESLAREWCATNGKQFTFSEYRNQCAQPVPHVDNFAAARNQAFQQATGEWRFWSDCDDLCSDPNELRRVIESYTRPVIIRAPYDVLGTGKQPLRERVFHRSMLEGPNAAAWRNPVHEVLPPREGDEVVVTGAVKWIHAPVNVDQRVNRKRNLSILSGLLASASSNYFYVHQEHYVAGRFEEADRFGRIALSLPNLDPSFKYSILLNTCRSSKDAREAYDLAMRAHGVFPWCREAIAMLIATAFDLRAADLALHWARLLASTPQPPIERQPWTHEPKWYGWSGQDMIERALRFAGLDGEAEAMRFASKPVISLIHATRGREQKAIEARERWMESALNPMEVEHILVLDHDDKRGIATFKQFNPVISQRTDPVGAWNAGAEVARGDILIQLSDDWVPPFFWDRTVREAIGDTSKPAVLAVNDGHRKQTDCLLCMAILTRARWEQQGRVIFPPEYRDVYSDNEFSLRAFADGVVIDRRKEIRFDHQHPAFGGAPMDETYKRHNNAESYRRGLELFKSRNPKINTDEHTARLYS